MFLIDIAKMFGYKSCQCLYDWMKYYNIDYSSFRYIENKFNKEELYEDYIIKCLGMKNDLPKKYNSTYPTIKKKLKEYGFLEKEYQEERLKNERILRNSNYEILYDKEKLKEYIEENGNTSQADLSYKLKVRFDIFREQIKKYNLEDMFDYTKSTFEYELQKLFPNMQHSKKDILYPYEIDLYDEEKKFGIEFNGNYWHGEKNKKRLYHQEKSKLAEEKEIFIYHIFEYEWVNKKEKIINQLNNLL